MPADRPFGNPTFPPVEDTLERALGDAIGRFDIIRGIAAEFEQEWDYFRGSGWMMRIAGSRKSLCYLIPLRNAFRLSMAIREGEREAFLADPSMEAIRPVLDAARKVPEGFAIAFEVDAATDFGPIRSLMEKLVGMRKAGRAAHSTSGDGAETEGGQA